MFIVEWAVLDFWYSLQYVIMRGLLKFPELLVSESELLQFLVCVLSSKFVVMSVNYVLSAFFLICALHGTRTVDFKLLRYIYIIFTPKTLLLKYYLFCRCGTDVFLEETFVSFKRGINKLWPYTGPRFPAIKQACKRKWAYRWNVSNG